MASFRRHENGTWEYRIRYKDPATQKYKEKSKRGFKTKKEAQLAAAKAEREIYDGTFPLQGDITYEQVFKTWWAAHSQTIKQSSRYTTKCKFTKHILPAFGKMKLREITPVYCQKVINQWAKEIKSVSEYRIYASQVLKYAVKLGYIAKNPMESVTIPRQDSEFLAGEGVKRNYWTREEVQEFLTLAKEHMDLQDYIMFYMLIYTGMRKGELLALEWGDVDLFNRSILIRQTLFFHQKKEIFQKVKTYEARTIYIDQKTARILQKWEVQQRERLLECGINAKPRFVLCRNDLRPLRLASPNEKLASFIKKYNLHPITVHGLRHTHASILFEAGASIKEVQARLGHRDINTTMDVYTHVMDQAMEKTADVFSKFMES